MDDHRQAKLLRDEFMNAYDADFEEIAGDAKIFKEQIDSLRNNEMAELYSKLEQHEEIH